MVVSFQISSLPQVGLMCLAVLHAFSLTSFGQNTRETETYKRMKAYIDSIPAIDTHDHLEPFGMLGEAARREDGSSGMNLASVFQKAYYPYLNKFTPWKNGIAFGEWWATARHDFDSARSTTFYRYLLPAFADLYGVDFDSITDEQAGELDRRIHQNYKSLDWIYEMVTERANIELMLNDPFWARITEVPEYKFCALVFNVSTLVFGFHGSEFKVAGDDPYAFAEKHELKVKSFDDYLALLDAIFKERKNAGAVCLKSAVAYDRTLQFDHVSRERAMVAFGKPRGELTPQQAKDFEDFIMWRLVELSAKYDLPFQIHTGFARIQGSNPMLLVDLIDANPNTKFILFHGGFPWVGEAAQIAMRYYKNVWLDSCFLPTISYSMAKRVFHEWLDCVPSDKIMWGADGHHVEGVYGGTVLTRQCLAEVLAEKIDRGDLREEFAKKIGKQIMRDNALEMFPSLKGKLWKHRGKMVAHAVSRPS